MLEGRWRNILNFFVWFIFLKREEKNERILLSFNIGLIWRGEKEPLNFNLSKKLLALLHLALWLSRLYNFNPQFLIKRIEFLNYPNSCDDLSLKQFFIFGLICRNRTKWQVACSPLHQYRWDASDLGLDRGISSKHISLTAQR